MLSFQKYNHLISFINLLLTSAENSRVKVTMKHLSVAGMITGLFVLTLLVVLQGAGDIFTMLAKTGWTLLFLTLIWLPSLIFTTESWRLLFRKEVKPAFSYSLAATWMGRSVNSLLPVATIGGEIVKARLMTLWGSSGIDATASMLVDKTVQVLAVIVWGLIGISLLIYLKDDDTFAMTALAGFVLLTLGVFGFFLVQRAGMFNLLAKIGASLVKSDKWDGISFNAKAVDETVLVIYRHQSRFWWSVIIKSLGLMVQTGEVWLACYLLGIPIGTIEAMILKSLTSTLGDIAFIIPNAYGIQEGAYIVIGAIFGLTPDLALAVSLATRIRELIVDVPGLLYWQFHESKLLLNCSRCFPITPFLPNMILSKIRRPSFVLHTVLIPTSAKHWSVVCTSWPRACQIIRMPNLWKD